MKRFFFILLLGASSLTVKADHITGGEMFYTLTGTSGNLNTYAVTLKLFMRCNSGRQFPNPTIISIFDRGNNAHIQDITVLLARQDQIQLTDYDPCISNPPDVCYDVAYYNLTVSLPASPSGYILASQVNFRIRGISNLDGSQVGATYTCEIPGTAPVATGPTNTSAVFVGSDLVIVCAESYFSYSFAAEDADEDELRYFFCAAYASSNSGTNGIPPGIPPYNSVPYNGVYSESSPLGNNVTIDPLTGLITGIAPPGGTYVVTVCVQEIRDGKVIATQRKDLQINIADCSIAAALLENDYMLCGDTRTISVANKSTSPLITSHDWDVYNPAGSSIFSSTSSILNYTFAVNGTYTIRLIVNRGGDCSDTTTALVYVYPGLVPDFEATGICFTKPTVFRDKTTLLSGSVNSWKWDFGELSTTLDVSTLQHPVYTYPSMGPKEIRLMVTTTDGCRDTVYHPTTIIDKPPISLAFRDTLICTSDAVQLHASGTGTFSWSPLVNITGANTADPTVSPAVTTVYYVDLETDGCINRDSVRIRVVDHVSLLVMPDTTICKTDTIRLSVVSDGLHYNWISTGHIIDPAVQNPFVVTSDTTDYYVTAIIGSCSTNENVRVNTVPYPLANAGDNLTICYNAPAQLHGETDGNSWQWSPVSTLLNATSLNPVAYPVRTTPYIFKAYDTRGCPKAGIDTVVVSVLPKIVPFAGRDTAVITGQPMQLNATGGESYLWSPAISLSSANISNPVAVFNESSFTGFRYKVQVYNSAGCFDTAFINIKVFATLPSIFVPTAFTPNNDGRNDLLVPVAVGMQQIEYFHIYDRWGQLVFSTTVNGRGWDGTIRGTPQGTNVYVWMVKAIDFAGIPYFRKGTFTLLR